MVRCKSHTPYLHIRNRVRPPAHRFLRRFGLPCGYSFSRFVCLFPPPPRTHIPLNTELIRLVPLQLIDPSVDSICHKVFHKTVCSVGIQNSRLVGSKRSVGWLVQKGQLVGWFKRVGWLVGSKGSVAWLIKKTRRLGMDTGLIHYPTHHTIGPCSLVPFCGPHLAQTKTTSSSMNPTWFRF